MNFRLFKFRKCLFVLIFWFPSSPLCSLFLDLSGIHIPDGDFTAVQHRRCLHRAAADRQYSNKNGSDFAHLTTLLWASVLVFRALPAIIRNLVYTCLEPESVSVPKETDGTILGQFTFLVYFPVIITACSSDESQCMYIPVHDQRELSSFLLSSGWKPSGFQCIHFNVKRQHSGKTSIFPKWLIAASVILLYFKVFLRQHSKSAAHWLTRSCGKGSLLFFPSRLYGPQFIWPLVVGLNRVCSDFWKVRFSYSVGSLLLEMHI